MRPGSILVVTLMGLVLAGGAGAAESGFAGTWINRAAAEGGVARVVVTEDAAHHLALRVFAKCGAQECDWGAQPGHGFSDDPASDTLSSLSAEFDAGFAHRRVTLQKDAGARLRFEVLTVFTDGSGRRDFAARGVLAAPGAPPVATADEDSDGFLGWSLGRAKPGAKTDTKAASDSGGWLSGWGLGRAKPSGDAAANTNASSGEDADGFLGWSLGPARPKPKAPAPFTGAGH